ncbi:MAG: efflux RND transporter periplasmic adaptor subunit [Chloroflexi bacterium]|nr:efflux RND transporter periplasmic adaptor subunit [Chloroflexota bacterium]
MLSRWQEWGKSLSILFPRLGLISLVPAAAAIILLAGCNLFPKSQGEPTFTPPPTPTPAPGTLITVKKGSISDTLKVRGKVVAANEAVLSFKNGGYVKAIYVAPGERVQKDALVAELDTSDREFDVGQAQYELQSAQLEVDRSRAAEISQAQIRVDNSKKKTERLDIQIQATNLQLDVQSGEIEAARAAADLQKQIVDSAWQAYQTIAYQNSEASAKALANYQSTQIAAKDADLRLTKALAGLETLKLTKQDLDVQKALNAQDTAILEQALVIARRDAQLDASMGQAKIANLKAKLAREQRRLAEMKLTSPLTGVVVSADARVGDRVEPFQIIGAVADPSVLRVEADVLQADIDKVSIQQPASVTLDAYPSDRYPAVVKEIASQASLWQGKNVYEIRLDFKDSSKVPATIRMGADISLVTKRKDNVLLVPKVAVRSDGSTQYVEVVEDGAVRRQNVETGVSSESDTEITSGIKEGQVIRIPG